MPAITSVALLGGYATVDAFNTSERARVTLQTPSYIMLFDVAMHIPESGLNSCPSCKFLHAFCSLLHVVAIVNAL